jgi:hypothetical protein
MRLARLIAVIGVVAGASSVGSAIVASAYQDFPFQWTISQRCVLPGATQTLTVTSGASVVNLVVKYPNGSIVRNVTGVFDAAGHFVDTWTVESNAPPGQAVVSLITVSRGQSPGTSTAIGRGFFTIGTPGQPCIPPPDVPLLGAWIADAATTSVKKVCDPGVSGAAVFRLSVFVTDYAVVAFTLPTSFDLSVACNGTPGPLPTLAGNSVVTLHEARPPTGAAAAPDTKITMAPADRFGTLGPTVTIHNTRATAAHLAQTGGGSQPKSAPWWLALVLGAFLVSTAWVLAGVRRDRRA